jgi:hypothetical protein
VLGVVANMSAHCMEDIARNHANKKHIENAKSAALSIQKTQGCELVCGAAFNFKAQCTDVITMRLVNKKHIENVKQDNSF